MSGTFPSVLPAQVILRSITPTRVSVAHSMKRIARSRGAHRWGIRLSFNPMSRSSWSQVQGFMAAQRGQWDTFTLVLAGYTVPQGTWPGSPVVDVAGQSGLTLNLRGFTASQTGVVKSGDLFKIANDAKVYMATADANSDGAGKAAVSINTPLCASPADGAVITSSNVPFTVAATADSFENALHPGMIGQIDLDLIEVP